SEEHTSELQSLTNVVCRLLLEKKYGAPVADTATSIKYPRFGTVLTICWCLSPKARRTSLMQTGNESSVTITSRHTASVSSSLVTTRSSCSATKRSASKLFGLKST